MGQKKLLRRDIDHINSILKELDSSSIEHIISQLDTVPRLLIEELLHSNKNWNRRILLKSLGLLRKGQKKFTYGELKKEYKIHQDNQTEQGKSSLFKYYIPVSYPVPDHFKLNNVSIRRVKSETPEYSEVIKKIETYIKSEGKYSPYNNENTDFIKEKKIDFLEFSFYERNSSSTIYDRFYSVFLLLKGILEFTYSKGSWSFSTQKISHSNFVHPLFVYLTDNGSDYILQYYKLNYLKSVHPRMTRNPEILPWGSVEKDISVYLSLFKKKISSNSTRYLLSNCFRLYNLGQDSSEKDRSFLYFWNILEEITLSDKFRGNTDEVLRRSVEFIKNEHNSRYRNYLKELSKRRNELVHRGINRIESLDVGFIKFMSEIGILYLIRHVDTVKTVQEIEHIYLLEGDKKSLESKKKMIDFLLSRLEKSNNKRI